MRLEFYTQFLILTFTGTDKLHFNYATQGGHCLHILAEFL